MEGRVGVMGKGLDRVLGWGGKVSECWFGQLEQITCRREPHASQKRGLNGPLACQVGHDCRTIGR
jgi:hypothetical protein